MMSEADPETTAFETRSNNPCLYSINSALPSKEEAYILRLPNELLQRCFQSLVDGDAATSQHRDRKSSTPHSRHCTSSRGLWATNLTCKSFSQLSQPLLYSDVFLLEPPSVDDVEQTEQLNDKARRRLRQFYRSTEQSPELMQFCKILAVTFEQSTWRNCHAALRQSASLRELTLVGNDLRFEHLGNVLGILRCLEVLTLSGVQCHEARDGNLDPAVERQRAANDRAALPFPDERGTATFSELHLQNFSRGSPYALANFLQWPKALEIFTVGIIGMGGYSLDSLIAMNNIAYPWTFNLLAYALQPQMSSLRVLRVGQMSTQEGLDNFDLHKFPNLEVFQVCCSRMLAAERAAQLWLTPKLKRLVLETSIADSQHGQIFCFREKEIVWLKQFAALVACETEVAKIGLETIEVLYEIDEYERLHYAKTGTKLRTSFSRAKQLVETHGIKFVYPTELIASIGAAAGCEEPGNEKPEDEESEGREPDHKTS